MSENSAKKPTKISYRKRKRAPNWDWSDTYTLIKLIKVHGKNWDLLLKELHNQHRVPSVQKSDQVRKHYQTATSGDGVLNKEYVHTPFFLTNNMFILHSF